jgi:hypothetical protein
MDLSDYARIPFNQFNGLYKRGLPDECPITHSPSCQNNTFSKRGDVRTRGPLALSLAFPHAVQRLFLSTINDNLVPLTCDGVGNLYKNLDGSPMFTASGMQDIVGLNMFDKTFILPLMSSGSSFLQVWDGTNPMRNAAGLAPTAGSAMTAADGSAGNVDIGVHQFLVSFVTNTGFTTQPGPKISGTLTPTVYTAPGSKQVVISNIPTGPTGTTQRVILATKSGLLQYFFAPGGTINDNTTTTVTLSFFDTDLTVDASYLFDLLEIIPSAGVLGALDKYHGRMLVVGPTEDLVLVSRPGEPEAFDNVAGFIQIPSERDGNATGSTFQLRDVLYFTKAPGIYSTNDNGGDPSSWPIFPIDGGCGALTYGVSSITASQGHLTANDIALLADLDGLFYFDGVVRRPPLTWNIDDVWKQYVTIATIPYVTVFMDPFTEVFYVSVKNMPGLLVGDFSDGLDSDHVKWTMWTFPANVQSMTVCTLQDAEFAYRLRLSFLSNNNLYKYLPGTGPDIIGPTAVDSIYTLAKAQVGEGQVNVFRYIRIRALRTIASGNTNLALKIFTEDMKVNVTPPAIVISDIPGQDYARQINLMNEQMYVQFRTNGSTDGFILSRVEIFGKPLFPARPG